MTPPVPPRIEGARPEPPDTPFLCASCRFGLMIVDKVPLYSRREQAEDPHLEPRFFWAHEARCSNPRIAVRVPEPFFFPIVDCEGFEARPLGPETPAREKKRKRKKHKKKA